MLQIYLTLGTFQNKSSRSKIPQSNTAEKKYKMKSHHDFLKLTRLRQDDLRLSYLMTSIMSSPMSTQILAWSSFGCGTPHTQ